MGVLIAIGIASAAIAVIGAGIGTWQTIEARNQAADEADALEDQKKKEAKAAADSAAYAEQQHRRRMSLIAGKQRAVTAAAGVSGIGGSQLEADLDLVTQTELEALQIRRTGKLESQGKDFEARLAHYRAATSRGAIPYDIAGGVLTAASGATSAYSKWYGQDQTRKQMFVSKG